LYLQLTITMKIFALLSLFASAFALDMNLDADFPVFQKFMEKYNRRYSTHSETVGRFAIFKDNIKLMRTRNANKGLDRHGINQFADIHPNEFRSQYLGLTPVNKDKFATRNHVQTVFNRTELKMAESGSINSINWATKGATTAIKNQGQCGSCWAFSAAEQVESTIFLNTGKLPLLAEQTLVSCDTTDSGCNGGNPINAWGVMNGWGGDEYNKDYPYTSGSTQADGTCSGIVKADLAPNSLPNSYSMISSKASDESAMGVQIQKSPMSVCVDATLWQTYTGGLITKASKCGTSIDHAVQAIGINTDTFSGKEYTYWIVRNSWTATWGEEGYVYVEYGQNNCGITAQATTVILA
jgi:cysteine peptidase B